MVSLGNKPREAVLYRDHSTAEAVVQYEAQPSAVKPERVKVESAGLLILEVKLLILWKNYSFSQH